MKNGRNMGLELNKSSWACLIISFIIFLALLAYIWKFTVDDAYITFRYALHLAQGFGIVWNVGESPVEGYSNFLWVIIASVLIKLNMDPVLFTKIIGIGALIGTLYIYWKIATEVFHDKKLYSAAFAIAAALLLINPATAIHTVSGLETMPYTLFVLILSYLSYKLIKSFNKQTLYFFAFISLICSILRPEGMLISMGLFILIYFMVINKNKVDESKIKTILPFILVYLFPIAIYMAFRMYYFNEIFPLPFLVKTVTNGSIGSGIYKLSEAIKYIAPLLIVILIAFINRIEPIFYDREGIYKRLRVILITMATTIIFADIIYVFSSLYMNYAQRFYYPSFVLIYILTGISLVVLLHEMKNSFKIENLKQLSKYAGFLIVFLLLMSNLGFVSDYSYLNNCSERFPVSYVSLGTELNEFSDLNLTFASIDSGSLPYFSNWNQIDMAGLNDKFIAKNGFATEDYLQKSHPELIIILSGDGTNPAGTTVQQPFIKYAEENGFVKLPAVYYKKEYYLLPYLDPKVPEFEKIKAAILRAALTSWK
ncbi:MAG: hypothetical protein HZC47_02685 [Methanobacterium sp.]|uniref:hypothetical protein n=1 Tax=Methanobacterium sp. TaxID=2164 RepID=UPI003D65D2F9|nr:hypothetical protein [Methanobacterium sp.]